MRNLLPPPLFKLWLASVIYMPALILALGFVFPDSHFPTWLELVLKISALLAFLVIVFIPLIHLMPRVPQKNLSQALKITAYSMTAGYGLLAGVLLYIKLKTCSINAIPYDSQWHCNVSGKGVVVYFIAIPIVAAIAGLLYAGVSRLICMGKQK